MDSELSGFIGCSLCGLLVAGCGLYMVVTGNPRLMHGYHYALVPPEKMPALARWSGAGLIAAGIGCALLIPPAGAPVWLTVIGIVLFVAGLVLSLGSIVRFNGSLFAFGGSAGGAFGSRSASIGFGALTALIALALTAVPGVQMIVSGDPSILHGYHLANVDSADLPLVARGVGAGMVALGCGIALMIGAGIGLSGRRPLPLWGRVLVGIAAALAAAGLIALFAVIIHFNGSLMG